MKVLKDKLTGAEEEDPTFVDDSHMYYRGNIVIMVQWRGFCIVEFVWVVFCMYYVIRLFQIKENKLIFLTVVKDIFNL